LVWGLVGCDLGVGWGFVFGVWGGGGGWVGWGENGHAFYL